MTDIKPPNKKQRELAAETAMARSTGAFVLRRRVDGPILGAALGAGIAAGAAVAYLAAIWLARTPLDRPPLAPK
ncbi:hypothetical protein, partial [Roseisolibacter sp. H3M3-2]|uniref:hypothetical protein n=1 Tax=Roseisolibacter sp. H3M3-2 TaxID=3031323 RepID=UPI0023DCE8D0